MFRLSIIAEFAWDYEPDCSSIEACIAAWKAYWPPAGGKFYVYGYRAENSIFYIGKGCGRRAWDTKRHRHERFWFYTTKLLSKPYGIEILQEGLSEFEAEHLEQTLITCFHKQLVNWAHGSDLKIQELRTYREEAPVVFRQGREAERAKRWAAAAGIYRQFLAKVASDEARQDEHVLAALQGQADELLACRVDLYDRIHHYKPLAPPLACQALDRLTQCLCKVGEEAEARAEVDAFQHRYPHGSFRPYEVYVPAVGHMLNVGVTKREQATLRRVGRTVVARKDA